MLPAVFADDDLAQRFVGGLDDVLAPILNVLDCLDSYFTPALAPVDFTRVAGQLGRRRDRRHRAGRPAARGRRRRRVSAPRTRHPPRPVRGGPAGLRRGARRSPRAAAPPGTPGRSARSPASRRPRLHVTLRLPDPTAADQHRLDSLVAAARPAHMPYTVQVTAAERTPER